MINEDVLPMYDENDTVANLGVNLVEGKILKNFSWIFREQVKTDLGIDCQIEIVTNNQSEGRIIAGQIKTGESFFKHESEDNYTYYGELKHLNYWTKHSLPVILILCNQITEECYWIEVSNSNIIRTKKSWKIEVPKKQRFNKESIKELTNISNIPRHKDIIKASIYEFLIEKYDKYSKTGAIEIVNTYSSPREMMYFDIYAILDAYENPVVMTHHYDEYGKFSEKELTKYIEDTNMNEQLLMQKLNSFMFIISSKKENLILNNSLKNIISNNNKINVFRLLYVKSNSYYRLVELDNNNEEIYYYE